MFNSRYTLSTFAFRVTQWFSLILRVSVPSRRSFSASRKDVTGQPEKTGDPSLNVEIPHLAASEDVKKAVLPDPHHFHAGDVTQEYGTELTEELPLPHEAPAQEKEHLSTEQFDFIRLTFLWWP